MEDHLEPDHPENRVKAKNDERGETIDLHVS